jgi:hypothetical protein
MTTHFTLELYYEHDDDRAFAEAVRVDLIELVRRLAPHLTLEVLVVKASAIRRGEADRPYHDAGAPGRQTMLVTREEVGAQGWGWTQEDLTGRGWGQQGHAVVSTQRMEDKARRGGDPADISIHEWLHTIEGLEIRDGDPVPWVDCGNLAAPFPPTRGPDDEDVWHDWYRHMLRQN